MSREASTGARLVLDVEGGPSGIELPRAGVLTVGSHATRADLVLEGPDVSDVHCAIGRVKGKDVWALKDLGSDAGTRLNGKPVAGAKLSAGDRIEVGGRVLRVVDAAAPVPPPHEPEGSASPASELTRTAVAAARAVQGYRIEKPLGRGGMGQVFLAVQESLQRKVAIKALSERFSADQDFVRRFQAEARAAAALNHPNVVTVHDVWEENGRHYLSMEYMDGGTLETKLARAGRLSAAETLDVLSDAVKGLVFAELRGIVHRDIKPANLMLNEVGTVKIADLGLATHLEAEATEDGGGKIFGTPHFISPEQARGERVDGRSDLYSLGATAYRLLSGRTPFEGESTRDILRGHFYETPRPLIEIVPEVPRELSDMVAKLLEKEPQDRYGSAGELLKDLERLKSHLVHGVGATGGRAGGGGRRWLVAVVVLVLLGGGFAAWSVLRDGPPGDQDVRAAGTSTPPDPGDDPAGPPAVDPGAVAPETPEPAPPPPGDDDAALERLELEAQRAYEALSLSLDDAARSVALRELAGDFAGSTWAARFVAEAEGLDQKALESDRADRERGARVEGALGALRSAADLDSPERSVGAALGALAAVELDPRLADNPAFQARTLEVWRGALAAAADRADAAAGACDALATRGDFDELRARLEASLADLGEDDWPDLPEPLRLETPLELERLRSTREALLARHAGLHLERHAWELARLREDRQLLSEGFASERGLEAELAALDLDAARARLLALAPQLRIEAERVRLEELAEDLRAARGALDALVQGWQGQGWKRKSLRDPRSGRRSSQEAVGVDGRGVLVKDGADTDLVPWSAFGDSPAELHQLFFERLPREFTPEELRGVAALLRSSSVLRAVAEGDEVLQSGGRSLLTKEEAAELLAGFELAEEWARAAGSEGALAGEHEAARLFADALRAFSDQRWAQAQAGLERLLVEHRGTLLVRLLSDGRALPGLDERMLPVPAAPAPQPLGEPAADAPDAPAEDPSEEGR